MNKLTTGMLGVLTLCAVVAASPEEIVPCREVTRMDGQLKAFALAYGE